MKKVDWHKYAKDPVTPKRNKGEYASYRDMMSQVQDRDREIEKSVRLYKALEPRLREKLLDYMISRKPIIVKMPIKNFTDTLHKSESGAKFMASHQEIPVGTELTFDHTNNTMGQWVFKSKDGSEYEIFNNPVIVVDGQTAVKNAAFHGLMTRTNIAEEVLGEVKEENAKRVEKVKKKA